MNDHVHPIFQKILNDWASSFGKVEEDDQDPTPWCSGCGSMRKADCDCGPIAGNE